MSTDKKLTKEELFKKEPEKFYHQSELIIAIKENSENQLAPEVYVDPFRTEFVLRGAKAVIADRVDQMIYQREMMHAKKAMEDKKIISDMNQIIKK